MCFSKCSYLKYSFRCEVSKRKSLSQKLDDKVFLLSVLTFFFFVFPVFLYVFQVGNLNQKHFLDIKIRLTALSFLGVNL